MKGTAVEEPGCGGNEEPRDTGRMVLVLSLSLSLHPPSPRVTVLATADEDGAGGLPHIQLLPSTATGFKANNLGCGFTS